MCRKLEDWTFWIHLFYGACLRLHFSGGVWRHLWKNLPHERLTGCQLVSVYHHCLLNEKSVDHIRPIIPDRTFVMLASFPVLYLRPRNSVVERIEPNRLLLQPVWRDHYDTKLPVFHVHFKRLDPSAHILHRIYSFELPGFLLSSWITQILGLA